MLVWLGKNFWNREGSLGWFLCGSSWCLTGGGFITMMLHRWGPGVRGVHSVQKRSLWERREQSDWKGWLGSKGSGGVVNRRPEECVQFADWGCPWEVFCHTEVFKNQEQSRKTSEVGTLIKTQIRPACATEWWLPLEMGDSTALGGWVDRYSGSPALRCFNPVDTSSLLSSAGRWVCGLSFRDSEAKKGIWDCCRRIPVGVWHWIWELCVQMTCWRLVSSLFWVAAGWHCEIFFWWLEWC